MKLSEITQATNGQLMGADTAFNRITTDSRAVEKGDLFIALVGDKFDAHNFIIDVIERGAQAVVVSKKQPELAVPQILVDDTLTAFGKIAHYYRTCFNGPVVAITGSCGKTTVKGFLNEVGNYHTSSLVTAGNFNNAVGVPMTLVNLQNDHDFGFIEAGTSEPGEIAYLASLIQADVAIVNNVNPAHVEGFGSVEAIASEKFEIYRNEFSDTSTAIVNLDDHFAASFIEKLTDKKIIGFSISAANPLIDTLLSRGSRTIVAQNIDLDDLGRGHFSFQWQQQTICIALNVLGLHNVANALAAAACAIAVKIPLDAIAHGLSCYNGDAGRMQLNTLADERTIVNDAYNANPASMKVAIEWCSRFDNAIFVMGDMGELGPKAADYHQQVAAYALDKGVDSLMYVGQYRQQVNRGFPQADIFEDKKSLAEKLHKQLHSGQVALLKGSRSSRMEDVLEYMHDIERQAC